MCRRVARCAVVACRVGSEGSHVCISRRVGRRRRPRATRRRRGTWATLREALRGSSLDYTTAPVGRAIVMLAVPMVMEMAMESIFVVADVFWVAHLGADAVATVGLTESMLTMIYTLAMGLSIGATAIVARRIGEKDAEGAARAAVQAIALGVGRVGDHRRGRRVARAGAAGADGRVARGHRDRQHASRA